MIFDTIFYNHQFFTPFLSVMFDFPLFWSNIVTAPLTSQTFARVCHNALSVFRVHVRNRFSIHFFSLILLVNKSASNRLRCLFLIFAVICFAKKDFFRNGMTNRPSLPIFNKMFVLVSPRKRRHGPCMYWVLAQVCTAPMPKKIFMILNSKQKWLWQLQNSSLRHGNSKKWQNAFGSDAWWFLVYATTRSLIS